MDCCCRLGVEDSCRHLVENNFRFLVDILEAANRSKDMNRSDIGCLDTILLKVEGNRFPGDGRMDTVLVDTVAGFVAVESAGIVARTAH